MTGSTLSHSPEEGPFHGKFRGEGLLDLTRPLEEAMILPGDPPVEIEKAASLEKEGYRLSRIHLSSHSGTHLDPDNSPGSCCKPR